jgi:23S rRNA (uracil1939-C5)-methyltransferase
MSRKNKRQLFERVPVIDTGAKGKVIAKTEDGKVLLLNNAVPGDIVDVQTFKKRKNYFEGTAVHFYEYSKHRVEPVCKHFGTCGGCKWQHMDYESQLTFKQKEVENALVRIGRLSIPTVRPILGCDEPYYYRNKMEFSFSSNRWLSREEIDSDNTDLDRNALGFHVPGMWDKIIDIKECHLQAEPSNSIRLGIKKFAVDNDLSFYNPRNQSGLLRTLMIRTSSTGEVMVLLQFFYNDFEKRTLLLNFIKKEFPSVSSLLYVINPKGNDTFYDLEVHCFSGKKYIEETMEDLTFKINAKSFYQTNSNQAYVLYKVVREFADLQGDELVYDLYTGLGTIAQFVAKKTSKIVGIESIPEAIEAATKHAKKNKITNAQFEVGDMKKVFNTDFINRHGVPELVITDPPRDGMHKDVVEQLLQLAPERIVYVSCNPATQARDLALMDTVYKIEKVQPVDMFPHTHHVENVVLLKKRTNL